jgi:preprotein translocase subunit SecA
MNRHRDLIYTERRKILEGADLRSNILEMVEQEIERAFDAFAPGDRTEGWDVPSLITELKTILPLPSSFTEQHVTQSEAGTLVDEVIEHAHKTYEEKEQGLGADKMRTLERLVLLGTIDRLWVYHLTALDEMRQGIGLTGYGGRDPLVEYKREAHDMYTQLTDHIRQQVTRRIFHVTLTPVQAQAQAPQPAAVPANARESGPRDDVEGAAVPSPPKDGRRTKRRAAAQMGNGAAASAPATPAPVTSANVNRKVGRNDPCPCGSGKKYKKCHGSGALV